MSNQDPESRKKLQDEEAKQGEQEVGSIEKFPEELENLPPELKRGITALYSMQRFSGPISPLSPIRDKINEQHISKILEISEKDDERAFADTQSARIYGFLTFIVALGFLGFLTVFLVNKDVAVYQDVLKLLIIFGGGFGSGFGYKGYLDRKKK
ncbi:hypothetical protein [Microcoleus sp. FACHB-672]|uniref:hypothetical protein n=1 Tax=Microcoleus sp. FACHB-672 TaxID=2692825 RepID=UPI001689C28F|nr:hypothetical protein [Microcoleus sp. FACHB-672]MBD2039290.1 hypothetical protein [Microcoleus sp. FACHB-672]